jgi:Fur family transcriptional regulator, ferric uptake regulator
MDRGETILKKHHLKVTPIRAQVVKVIAEASYALSLQEIENGLTDPDRITLYRTLKNFEEKGIIHKVTDSTQVVKYAMCDEHCSEHAHTDEHVHFHCERCKNTFCLDHTTLPQVSLPQGYTFGQMTMTVSGVCKNCNS